MIERKNRVKFLASTAKDFACEQGQLESLLWDTDEKTLCIRARKSGVKAFYYQSRFAGKVLKIKLGDAGATGLTLDYARKLARKYQSQVDFGLDPRLVKAANILEAQRRHEEIDLGNIKFKDLWEQYIAANQMHWSEAYKHDHKKAMQSGGAIRKRSTKKSVAGVLFPLSNVSLSDINSSLLVAWAARERVSRPTVVTNGFRMLRAALNWADGTENYTSVLSVERLFKNKELRRMIPKPKAKQDVLLQQHLAAWFKAVERECDFIIAAYLKGLLITGARREELAGLRWSDVDFKWNSLRIRDKVEDHRLIPLTPYMKTILMGLPKLNEWVYSSPTSRSGRLIDPYRAHKRALDSEDLPHVTLHGLRRSFGSLSEWVECPTGVVAQIQGHKPSALVEKHYRVRPLDLLEMWHTKIESRILEFAKISKEGMYVD